jgi:hypothetical protein
MLDYSSLRVDDDRPPLFATGARGCSGLRTVLFGVPSVHEGFNETLQTYYSFFQVWLLWVRHADVPSLVSQ